MEKQEVILLLKSAAMAEKFGLPFNKIDSIFKTDFGCAIPYKTYGFSNLKAFFDDAVRDKHFQWDHRGDGTYIRAVCNEKTQHITELVSKQSTKRRRGGKRARYSVRSYRPPQKPVRAKVVPTIKQEPKKPLTTVKIVKDESKGMGSSPWLRSLTSTPIRLRNKSENTDVRGLPLMPVENQTSKNIFSNDVNNNNSKSVNKSLNISVTIKESERTVKIVDEKTDTDKVIKKLKDLSLQPNLQLLPRPNISQYILFGDDFFVEMAKYLQYDIDYRFHRSMSGMCKSGMTVAEAIHLLHSCKVFPEKIIILLGATDVMRGNSVQTVINELYRLLLNLNDVAEEIVICTIPPLLNLNQGTRKFVNLVNLNMFISMLEYDTDGCVKVIDLYKIIRELHYKEASAWYSWPSFKYIGDDLYPVFNNEGNSYIFSHMRRLLNRL